MEARRFRAQQVGTKEAMMAVQELEDYDEVVQRFLDLLPPEKRLAGLAPEQAMRAFTPEQRVAGLTPGQVMRAFAPEQVVLALPDDVLRALSDDFIAHLPEPTRTAVRKRLGR